MSNCMNNEGVVVQSHKPAQPSIPQVILELAESGKTSQKGILKTKTAVGRTDTYKDLSKPAMKPEVKTVDFREPTEEDIRYYIPDRREHIDRRSNCSCDNDIVVNVTTGIVLTFFFITIIVIFLVIDHLTKLKDQGVNIMLMFFLMFFCIAGCFITWNVKRSCRRRYRREDEEYDV